MPISRRHKFNVQSDNIYGRTTKPKIQNDLTNSTNKDNTNIELQKNTIRTNIPKRNKSSTSKEVPSLDIIVAENESCSSVKTMNTIKKRPPKLNKHDKDVTASSSNIDLFSILNSTSDLEGSSQETLHLTHTLDSTREPRATERGRNEYKREKPRHHRIKVRSPKRHSAIEIESRFYTESPLLKKCEVATSAIEFTQQCRNQLTVRNDPSESSHSLDDMCRICHGGEALSSELGLLVSACSCRGTVGRVHVKCLERWLTESGKSRCELCGTRYITTRVHRYGVPRALVMWVLSQNAKQLMVDSLGIMLMSPLAVLAAWLSGKTLAGLMMQETQKTPWPLASTFVLACMTLVCYYCWIVSAATRHALGWWIWYRSQYEVRLQLQEETD